MVEVLVLVVIWRDWRPNVQIAPINRTGGAAGCSYVKCLSNVDRFGRWGAVGGRGRSPGVIMQRHSTI